MLTAKWELELQAQSVSIDVYFHTKDTRRTTLGLEENTSLEKETRGKQFETPKSTGHLTFKHNRTGIILSHLKDKNMRLRTSVY